MEMGTLRLPLRATGGTCHGTHGVYREYITSPGLAERRVLYYNRLYSISGSLVTSQTSVCLFF